MGSRKLRAGLASVAAGVVVLGFSGVAHAVSGGGNNPPQQDCTPGADAYNQPNGYTEPGCHNLAVNVESGGTTQGNPNPDNTRYVEYGGNQQPNEANTQTVGFELNVGVPGQAASPHAGCLAANTDGTGGGTGTGCGNNPNGAGFSTTYDYYQLYCPVMYMAGNPCAADPTGSTYGTAPDPSKVTQPTVDTGSGTALDPILKNGLLIYFGMDDNNDAGEHDGVDGLKSTNTDGVVNGPSDGGGITASLTPQNAATAPSQTQPESLANFSTGMCADGICSETTTQQQTVYHGCDANKDVKCNTDPKKGYVPPQNGNVYDYTTNQSPNESANCNSGDLQSEQQCGPGGMDYWRSQQAQNVNAEPGVQVYSDPDPQRSPAAPAPFWPTPAVYAGTCGVYAGSDATTGNVVDPVNQGNGGPTPVTNSAGQVALDPNPQAC